MSVVDVFDICNSIGLVALLIRWLRFYLEGYWFESHLFKSRYHHHLRKTRCGISIRTCIIYDGGPQERKYPRVDEKADIAQYFNSVLSDLLFIDGFLLDNIILLFCIIDVFM